MNKTELIDLCPICIEKEAFYFTECGHKYCVSCLSKINKCAICRKLLIRSTLCVDIKRNNRNNYNRRALEDDEGFTWWEYYGYGSYTEWLESVD